MSRIDVMSQAVLLVVAQTMVLLALSPFIVGLIRKVKARLQCRRGASVFQPYADLAKLFKKQPVVSTTSSWIFTATPYIVFGSTLAAGLLVPTFTSQTPLNFAGNIIALVYLLALGTFFLILAGLDTGSAFGGMGSSREAIVASLTEPAMVLEYSGRYLALIEWAAGLKLAVFLSLIANVFAPWGIGITLAPAAMGIGLVVYLVKISGLAVLIGTLECMFAKLRLFRVTDLLGVAFILALLGLLFFYILRS